MSNETKPLTSEDLDAMKLRAEADGPGEPYACLVCGETPAQECECGGECEEPDEDAVCRDDRGRLLTEVDRLSAALREARALVAGLERDVAKLNAEGVAYGIRARAAERERDEANARTARAESDLSAWVRAAFDVALDGPELLAPRLRALVARAERAETIAKAERAARKAEEDVWLGAIGQADAARMEALRQARRVTYDALLALGVEP